MGLEYRQAEQVAFFVINNPSTRNALDYTTLLQFKEAVELFNQDSGIRAGIVTGTGNKAFCSGIDLKSTLPNNPEQVLPPSLMRGLETNKPLIAAVNGAALGGGFELVLACDIRVSVTEAVFGFPEVRLGLIPDWGGTQRIIRQLTHARASALLLTGMNISAQEAFNFGIINQVTDSHNLMSTAVHWADLICQAAPLAVQAAKEAMQKGLQLEFNEGLQLEDALYSYLKTTQDYREGRKAFLEHRKPLFKGE